MTLNDRDIQAAMTRLREIPGVEHVVPGAFTNSPHTQRPGHVRYLKKTSPRAALVRIFGQDGTQDVRVDIADPGRLQDVLANKTPASPNGSPLPPDARITRERKQQPVYPADPAPMKAAPPVSDTEIRGRLVTVTPEIALNWLERNTRNRPLRDSTVSSYATDMKAGRWKQGGVVVKFGRDGSIINGQHTLWAITEAGVAIDLYVLTGLDPDVVLVEDDHARRRVADVMRIQRRGATVTNIHTAVGAMIRHSVQWNETGVINKDRATRQEEIAFLERHMDAIEFAVGCFSSGDSRGIRIASVIAPVARASYTADKEQLQRFARVVQTGLVEHIKENAAVLLRNWLMAGIGTLSSNVLTRVDTYRKTERAIRAFLDGETLKVLKAGQDELFLLPGEKLRRRRGVHP